MAPPLCANVEVRLLVRERERERERVCKTYRASGQKEKVGGGEGADELGHPVEKALQQGDVAAEEGAERDGGIDVATGDVGADGDGSEERESISHRRRHQAGRCRRRGAR